MAEILPRFAGPVITLGDRQFVLPPMNLATHQKLEAARISAAGGAPISDGEVAETVVLETLQRNYPDLSVEQLRACASPSELLDAFITIQEQEATRIEALGKRAAALMVRSGTSTPPSPASAAN